jgi:predicted P-loop ATPase
VRIDELARDRAQLLAEARDRFQTNSPWWLDSKELNERAEEEQADRCEEDPWQELIMSWAEGRLEVSIQNVLTQCIEKPRAQWTQQDRNRVARCLRTMGWRRHRVGPRGDREWRYKRP